MMTMPQEEVSPGPVSSSSSVTDSIGNGSPSQQSYSTHNLSKYYTVNASFVDSKNFATECILDPSHFARCPRMEHKLPLTVREICEIVSQLSENEKAILMAPIQNGLLELESIITVKNKQGRESVPIRVQDFLQAVVDIKNATASETVSIISNISYWNNSEVPERLLDAAIRLLRRSSTYASINNSSTIFSSIENSARNSISIGSYLISPSSLHLQQNSLSQARYSRMLDHVSRNKRNIMIASTLCVVLILASTSQFFFGPNKHITSNTGNANGPSKLSTTIFTAHVSSDTVNVLKSSTFSRKGVDFRVFCTFHTPRLGLPGYLDFR
jgi:hypothetical protein